MPMSLSRHDRIAATDNVPWCVCVCAIQLWYSHFYRQTLKERLTYLVPSTVHFMDETFMNEVVEDAVNHLIGVGND